MGNRVQRVPECKGCYIRRGSRRRHRSVVHFVEVIKGQKRAIQECVIVRPDPAYVAVQHTTPRRHKWQYVGGRNAGISTQCCSALKEFRYSFRHLVNACSIGEVGEILTFWAHEIDDAGVVHQVVR